MEGARGWWGGREPGEGGEGRGGSKEREGGSDDPRQGESISGGREG